LLLFHIEGTAFNCSLIFLYYSAASLGNETSIVILEGLRRPHGLLGPVEVVLIFKSEALTYFLKIGVVAVIFSIMGIVTKLLGSLVYPPCNIKLFAVYL